MRRSRTGVEWLIILLLAVAVVLLVWAGLLNDGDVHSGDAATLADLGLACGFGALFVRAWFQQA